MNLRRLLLDPTGGEGGGNPNPAPAPQQPTAPSQAQPPTQPAAPQPQQQAQAQPPAPQNQGITLSPAQFQEMLSAQQRLAELQANEAQRIEQEVQQRIQGHVAKGEHEQALQALREQSDAQLGTARQQLQDQTSQAHNYALSSELTQALSNHDLMPGAAAQLTALLRPQLKVQAEGNTLKVRSETMEDATAFVNRVLAQPEYAHFLKAKGQGGPAIGADRNPGQEPQEALNGPQQAFLTWAQQRQTLAKAGNGPLGLNFAPNN